MSASGSCAHVRFKVSPAICDSGTSETKSWGSIQKDWESMIRSKHSHSENAAIAPLLDDPDFTPNPDRAIWSPIFLDQFLRHGDGVGFFGREHDDLYFKLLIFLPRPLRGASRRRERT